MSIGGYRTIWTGPVLRRASALYNEGKEFQDIANTLFREHLKFPVPVAAVIEELHILTRGEYGRFLARRV